MSKKKVLVAYATAGIGHKKAALAVFEALRARGEGMEIKLIDTIDYTSPFFKRTYARQYLLMINRLILLWGFLYYSLDFRIAHVLLFPLRRLIHVLNSAPLIKFLLEYKPDIVVSTHFLLPDVCSHLRRKYNVKMHVMNVITDYRPHSFWISDSIDTYVVGHEETKKDLVRKWGVPPGKIEVMGIPVEPKFCAKHDRTGIRKGMGIPDDSFVVLLSGGGYGVGPIFRILEELEKTTSPLTVITVCGHNRDLYERVEMAKREARINIINFGFVDNVDELMAASDVYVGKAGGISITEAFAQDLPFIFVRPIPGQEMRNATLFLNMGVGVELRRMGDILKIIDKVRPAADGTNPMRENIRRIKKSDAARNVAQFIAGLLKS